MLLESAVLITAVVAGGIASVTGFGIGSLLTPLLSLFLGTQLAVAIVAIPHFAATALRLWFLRSHVDRSVFWKFGLLSAIGGLSGALLHASFTVPTLQIVLAIVLLVAGTLGVTGWTKKLRIQGPAAWIAGILSGALGGLVGNQGGIRSAALLGFQIPKNAFVATTTAVGLVVDSSRLPVYFWSNGTHILQNTHWLALTTLGTVGGTVLGMLLLRRVPEALFHRIVSGVVLLLGLFLLLQISY